MDDNNRPIGVNDTITPITKIPIDQIDASLWHDMDIGDLTDQRIFLQNRLAMVINNSGHPDVIAQMHIGLQNLDAIIQSKNVTTESGLSSPNANNIGLL